MRFSYRLTQDKDGWLAECVESEAAGEGKTREDAIASLRESLEERLFRPDAVAPPSKGPKGAIELVRADEPKAADKELDLGGPGDPP